MPYASASRSFRSQRRAGSRAPCATAAQSMRQGTLVRCATWSVTAPATPKHAASIAAASTSLRLQERRDHRLEAGVVERDEFGDVHGRGPCRAGREEAEQCLRSADVACKQHGRIIHSIRGLTFRRRSLIFAINDVAPVIGWRSLRPARHPQSLPCSYRKSSALSREVGAAAAFEALRAIGASTRSPICSPSARSRRSSSAARRCG